jgi:hypothetical protein
MRYGICKISIAPLRLETSDSSEMVSQALYGELFKILDHRKNWLYIRLHHDLYEGWIDDKQVLELDVTVYDSLTSQSTVYSSQLTSPVAHKDKSLSTLTIGAQVSSCDILSDTYIDKTNPTSKRKYQVVDEALQLINAPYLWGGRTPFGIDCSGFTQLIYRLCGEQLKRDASQQAAQGEALSFIEESSPGDLAFFDNREGLITHVGIIMEDHHIIHAHGKVRIDRLDQTGIYNVAENYHSHKLRVIKSIF